MKSWRNKWFHDGISFLIANPRLWDDLETHDVHRGNIWLCMFYSMCVRRSGFAYAVKLVSPLNLADGCSRMLQFSYIAGQVVMSCLRLNWKNLWSFICSTTTCPDVSTSSVDVLILISWYGQIINGQVDRKLSCGKHFPLMFSTGLETAHDNVVQHVEISASWRE